MAEVHISTPSQAKFIQDDFPIINTTSRTKEKWSMELSPFVLGPVHFDNKISLKMENAWQYSKVYAIHLDENGEPNQYWLDWSSKQYQGIYISNFFSQDAGFANSKPQRAPMGKGAIPEYSFFEGEHLDYISARKIMYAPFYARLVLKTAAFKRLLTLYKSSTKIHLLDFDGYDYLEKDMTLQQVIDEPTLIMGHAFVLTMLLKREILFGTDIEKQEILDTLDRIEEEIRSKR